MAEAIDIRELNERIERQSAFVTNLMTGMDQVIVGQKHLVESLLIGLLSDGHILLEGVPGLAKTLAIKTLASLIDAKYSRIQFTPDLMPSDVLGTTVFNMNTNGFDFHQGPIFADIVLVDETKFHDTLAFQVPVVVEVLPKAFSIVKKKLEELNGNVELRTASNKDGFLMSDEGNILLDVYFDGVQDIDLLNQTLLMMPGVVDTSLFVDILTGMILVNDKGVFKKKKNCEFCAL